MEPPSRRFFEIEVKGLQPFDFKVGEGEFVAFTEALLQKTDEKIKKVERIRRKIRIITERKIFRGNEA
ncbi:unnamed protein product [Lactuca virosa]|uniref:Uncharacterized protein n=1 Tax=Lactuca virosa TaxID=75947 RepID=A0AAU9PHN7_9ASTR|nr:unnamed protein product [Lactuca virosa]